MSQEHTSEFKVKDIWRVFWVLAGITAIEFVVALAIPETIMPKPFKVGLYLVLTLMKAFYIVAYFMHLKFERLTSFTAFYCQLFLSPGSLLLLFMRVIIG